MRRLRASLALAGMLLAALSLAGPASAATHVGDDCVADVFTGEKTLVGLVSAQPGAQLAMPANGVITRVQIAGQPGYPGTIAQRLKLLRPTGGPLGFATVAEDVLLVKGTTAYDYRLPVQAGDRLGLASEGDLFFCSGQAGAEVGFIEGDLPLGSSGPFSPVPNLGVPVSATLEPDADGDGWGDETQDQCPQSAEVLVACPKLGIDAYALQTKGSARVFAAIYGPGKATIAFSGKLTIPAGVSPSGRALKLTWKGSRPGTEGQFTSARLKFSRNLIDVLKKPGVALPLKINLTAINVAGLKSTRKLSLKVR